MNIVFWIGVKSPNIDMVNARGYGDYSWMEYSRKTWEYWCGKNNCLFVPYEQTSDENHSKIKINWQRWFDVFDYIKSKGITDYDQILLVDASIMVKWDAPNMFDISEHKFCALTGTENLAWTMKSKDGYLDLFPNTRFRVIDYFASGFCIFNKDHEPFLKKFKDFYYNNIDAILDKEDVTIKRGRDQPVLNYFLRSEHVEFKMLPIVYGVNHMYRRQVLGHNWQLNIDTTPFFIKYFYTWIYSGWSDRGNTRTQLMKQTWDAVKHNYI